jgi:hypothetical protein
MKKLALDLDSIDVTSFPTTQDAAPQAGTVHGAEITSITCGATCANTCQTSCAGGGACTCYPG